MIKSNKIQGFTLLELMITLAIAAIIATIGIPSFMGLIRDSRMTASVNDLLSSINYARSEAITRNVEVTIKSESGGNAWEDGWNVYIDADNDGVIDSTELLKTHGPLPTGYTLNANISGDEAGVANVAGVVVYIANGLMSDITGGSFFMCLDNDTTTARAVVINNVGRARIDSTPGQCAP
jgi:type IV fimbrial biogenesis protein FimT